MASGWLFIRLWLIVQVCIASGAWLLSAFGQLSPGGYALYAIPFVIWSVSEWRRSGVTWARLKRDAVKLGRRLRRPLPLTFLAIWVLSLVGGMIWLSTYVDTLSYRLPRALHWLSENRWHWISSDDSRVNVVGLNLEFLWLPLLLLLKGDRLLFLPNLIAYSFLPAMFFSFLRSMRVSRRVCWSWMWIFPGGYVFALQAASLGGDGYSATVALAAVALALRSRHTGDVRDVWFSVLAAGFLTGIKQVNIPLGLVWTPAIVPSLRLLRGKLGSSAAVFALAISVSFIPLMALNTIHTGSWKGFSKSELAIWEQASAAHGMLGGAFSILLHNAVPPVFPFAGKWNALMATFVSTEAGRPFRQDAGFALLQTLIGEHTASMGAGIVLLLVAGHVAARRVRGRECRGAADWSLRLIRWMPFVAVFVFLAKSNVSFGPRYVAPYYPFFLPILLAHCGMNSVVRRRWWVRAAVAVNLVTIGLLLLSRQRPMWPALSLSDWLKNSPTASPRVQKIADSFALIHRTRLRVFPAIQRAIPPDERVIGYAAGNHSYLEYPLWLPIGSRKVSRVSASDTPESVRARGIRHVLVDPSVLEFASGESYIKVPVEDWLKKYRATIIATFDAGLQHQHSNWVAYWVKLD